MTQPRAVTAVAGYDAISHAVESFVTTRRTRCPICSRSMPGACSTGTTSACWPTPDDVRARGAMLLGAHHAGIAIEQSMLGAAHACANPLTAHYGTTHGVAIAVMLPHVVRWNAELVADRYRALLGASGRDGGRDPGGAWPSGSKRWHSPRRLPQTLRELGVPARSLPRSPPTRRPSGPAPATPARSMPHQRSPSTSRRIRLSLCSP